MLNFKKGYIVVFTISVLGLAFIQYQYLKIGLNLAKVQFNSKVGQAVQTIKQDLETNNELTFLVAQAITKNDAYFKLSVDSIQDASRYFLNDFLVDRLLQNGIKSDFSYRLYTNDSLLYLTSPNYIASQEEQLNFPIVLSGYLPKELNKRLILELQFEDLNKYFFSQLNGLTIPSLIFIIAIILVVFWVLRSFYWQRNVITTTNQFINNLTHELKTPVFSIGLATKLLEEKSDDSLKPFVSIIREQNDKLKVQIEKVLDLAGLEHGKSVIKFQLINFKSNLLALAQSFLKLSELEGVKFDFNFSDEDYFILCEPNHLENAVSNLLENAKKYSKNSPEILLNTFISHNFLHIEVKDNGVGIPEKELKNVFKKFHRVGSGDLHTVKGYGLGLSYVKEIVRLHNGKISLESKMNEGTTVTIKLPIKLKGYE
ncbi:sensor histidine kinase [Joostella sp. CR20]|uniref:sensor histidine kinase n=1 Tax=Joostella sp. CR20 TaxID=2804312 RepID=UPI00313B86DC